MTAKEKIKRIEDLLDDLNLSDMSRNDLYRELKGMTFNEIEENVWELYCFVSDVRNVVNL